MTSLDKIKAVLDEAKAGDAGAYEDLLGRLVGEGLAQLEAMQPPMWACSECGSTDVQAESWVPLNRGVAAARFDGTRLGEVVAVADSSDTGAFCNACNEHVRLCELDADGVCEDAHHKECARKQNATSDGAQP